MQSNNNNFVIFQNVMPAVVQHSAAAMKYVQTTYVNPVCLNVQKYYWCIPSNTDSNYK